MPDIFANHIKNVFDNWTTDIREQNVNGVKPISLYIPAKLIVFAWSYATYQTYDLKNRLGNLNFVTSLESIFINKIAQIAYALYCGYSDDDILTGKSFVDPNPESKDERFFVDTLLYNGNKPVVISGTKKFNYPFVKKNPNEGQLFIYVDAARYTYNKSYISRLNIQNNSLKVTLLGFANKTDIRLNQDQKKLLDYSNIYSAFTGFSILKSVDNVTYVKKQYVVPKFVNELICCGEIDKKLTDIVNYIKSVNDNKPIVKVNYSALFDPILNEKS